MRKMNRKSEDSLKLMLSQDDTERRMQNGVEDDDLHLWLSQSQTAPTQQSMDDTVVSDITSPDNDVQMNVREILNMIRHNHQWRSDGNWRPGAKLNFGPPSSIKFLRMILKCL